MTKVRPYLLKVGIALGISLLIYQTWRGVSNFPFSNLSSAAIPYLLLALLLVVLAILQQVAAWNLIMHSLGTAITWANALRGYLISFAPRYIPGTIWGYLSRSEWLLNDFNVPYRTSNLGSIFEVLISLCACLVVILVSPFATDFSSLTILAAVILPFAVWGSLHLLNRFQSRRPWLDRIVSIVRAPITLPQFLAVFGLYLLNWFFYGLSIWLVVTALGLPLPALSVHLLLSISGSFALAWLAGFLVLFVPSGLGVREVTLSALLADQLTGLADGAPLVSVLSRLVITLAELILIIAALIWSRLKEPGKSPT